MAAGANILIKTKTVDSEVPDATDVVAQEPILYDPTTATNDGFQLWCTDMSDVPHRLGVKINQAAAADPGVTNDASEGYSRGSMWINEADDGIFLCTDNTDGAAVWSEPAGAPDQNLWLTMTGDTGSIAANTTTDSFGIVGTANEIETAISGDSVVIGIVTSPVLTTPTISGNVTFDEATQDLTLAVTDQTVGTSTATIPDLASTSDTFAFVTLAATLANKTISDTGSTIDGGTITA